jgi:hypothetical protein
MRSDHKRNGGSEGKTSLAERKKPLAVPLTTGNRSREVVGGQLSVVGGALAPPNFESFSFMVVRKVRLARSLAVLLTTGNRSVPLTTAH